MINNIIENSEDINNKEKKLRSFNLSAKQKLNSGDINGAYEDFSYAENVLGCAYCKFIQGNTDEAFIMLNLVRDLNPAINWLLCLIGILKGDKTVNPTYFQIRNFYEPDMNMLFKYKNYDFIKKICMANEYLYIYNKEIYKFSARVFMDNNEYQTAINFLKKSADVFYRDPEVHFMLGEAYMATGNRFRAISEFLKANEVTGGYYPAEKKLSEF